MNNKENDNMENIQDIEKDEEIVGKTEKIQDAKKEIPGDHFQSSKKSSSKSFQTNKELPKGVILKRAREKQGLTLEAVHEGTKVPMDALRAIEEGYTIRTLSPFYHKGFLKIYAQYLNIDVSQVVDGYEKINIPKRIDNKDFTNYGMQEWISKILTRKRKQQIVIGCGIFLGLFLTFKILALITSAPIFHRSDKNKTRVEKITPQVESKQTVTRNVSETQKISATASSASVQNSFPAGSQANKNVSLTVRSLKKSWLRVKSDDEVVFQSTLDKGDVESWGADKQIEISGRNISELEFELNGKMIGTLGRADRNAKTVVITKDGLSVTR